MEAWWWWVAQMVQMAKVEGGVGGGKRSATWAARQRALTLDGSATTVVAPLLPLLHPLLHLHLHPHPRTHPFLLHHHLAVWLFLLLQWSSSLSSSLLLAQFSVSASRRNRRTWSRKERTPTCRTWNGRRRKRRRKRRCCAVLPIRLLRRPTNRGWRRSDATSVCGKDAGHRARPRRRRRRHRRRFSPWLCS